MTYKLNALVAAALLVGTSTAHAISGGTDGGVATGDSVSAGNAYLLLTVLDANFNNGVGRSYTRSLEVAMNDFGTINRPTGGFTSNADAMPDRTWATGALWSTFTSGMSTTQISALQWDVTALDSNGTSAADQKRIFTTSGTNLESLIAASGSSITNSEVNNATLNQDIYWDAAIAAMGSGTEIIIDDTTSNAFAISAAVHSTNFSTKMPDITTVGNVGDSMGFYYLTRSSSSNTAEALAEAYGTTIGASTFTLGTNGALTFAAPVPEASTYGMMLAGLGLVGFVAARRRNI